MSKRICKVCKKDFIVPKSYGRKRGFYCSSKCYGVSKKGQPTWNKGKHTGIVPRSAFKKGQKPWCFKGWRKTSQGYIQVYSPKHPFRDSNNYVFRSRLVMEKHLGRYLKPEESVHHLNQIRDDDRRENLILFPSKAKHISFHSLGNQHNKGRIPWNKKK